MYRLYLIYLTIVEENELNRSKHLLELETQRINLQKINEWG